MITSQHVAFGGRGARGEAAIDVTRVGQSDAFEFDLALAPFGLGTPAVYLQAYVYGKYGAIYGKWKLILEAPVFVVCVFW